jgi:excisionase family DNA binding protein
MLSLAQAAKATGKSRPTIARAIKNGKISATRTETGAFAIDPAELARVFPLAPQSAGTMKQDVPPNGAGTGMLTIPALSDFERESLQARITEQAETIRQLWQRLDAAEGRVTTEIEERRRLLTLLTDQRLRPWWRRWFR